MFRLSTGARPDVTLKFCLRGMSERTLQYFLIRGRMEGRDAAGVCWAHAVNSRSRLMEALSGSPASHP